MKAKAWPYMPNYRSKTEAEYARVLELSLQAGKILRWDYEPERLSLDGGWYKPDFRVLTRLGIIEFHEVKGRWRTADRLRIKIAAKRHPMYRFKAFMKKKGIWTEEVF